MSVPDLSFLFVVAALVPCFVVRWPTVALDPAPNERAKIGLRAIARIGRRFVRVRPEIGFDGIEQWRKLSLIARRVGQRVRHDDLMGAIDGGLCVVALDEAALGGASRGCRDRCEVALRLGVFGSAVTGLGLASHPALAAVAGSRRRPASRRLRLRRQALASASSAALAGTDLPRAASLYWPSSPASSYAALRGSELTILGLVGLGGFGEPALDFRRKPRFGLYFIPAIAHRLVDPGIGLDLGCRRAPHGRASQGRPRGTASRLPGTGR